MDKQLVEKAKIWFEENEVEVPKTVQEWQSRSVRKGEIPPGMGYATLVKKGSIREFIGQITNNHRLQAYNTTGINYADLGFELIDEKWKNKHKKVLVACKFCALEEWLDYSTLGRMKKAGTKYCRYCRNAGGKRKTLKTYDLFEDFVIISNKNSILTYQCKSCTGHIDRYIGYVTQADYLVCEHCHPYDNIGAKIKTNHGRFDSKIEYLVYKRLLCYFSQADIIRQAKYDDLFNTKTKHTADFFIPSLCLVIEVTTRSNKIREKYFETLKWKLSISNNIKVVYSVREVDDIVRSLLKDRE